MRIKGIAPVLLLLAGTLSLRAASPPMWRTLDRMPVDRLLENARAAVAESPEDPHHHYILGRIHGYAFTLAERNLAVRRDGSLFDSAPWQEHGSRVFTDWSDGTPPERADAEEMRGHLAGAVEHLGEAIRLDPESSLAHLGLASVMETAAGMVGWCDTTTLLQLDAPGEEARVPLERAAYVLTTVAAPETRGTDWSRDRMAWAKETLWADREAAAWVMNQYRLAPEAQLREVARELLREVWLVRTREHLLRAWQLGRAEPDAELAPSRFWRSRTAYEAGLGLRRIDDLLGRSDEEQELHEEIRQYNIALGRQGRFITPLVCALDHARPLDDLMDATAAVPFDLDGDGTVEQWPWPRPDAGWLVWDPDETGVVKDGTQLFGSVTWWLFPKDGYHALSLLDTDRDGHLRGPELDGVALWQDRNQDGVSDPGEVRPVAALGIRSLATTGQETSQDGPSLVHPTGLILEDGRRLPTYDWIGRSHPVMDPEETWTGPRMPR